MKKIPEKSFYYIRHGVTFANQQRLMCGGDWDIPLHPDGIVQAEKVASFINKVNPPIEEIYVSSMLRARQTAEIINRNLGLSFQIVEEIKEWRMGEWEKIPWDTLPNIFTSNVAPPKGETKKEFTKRIQMALTSILENARGTPLIVAHGAVGNILFNLLDLGNPEISNCQLTYLHFHPEKKLFHAKLFNGPEDV